MAKTSKSVPLKEKAPSSSRSTKSKPVVPPRIEECIPPPCEITSDFKVEKPVSTPGRCEPMSRYICLVTKAELDQVKEDCEWDNKEVVIPSSEEDITTYKAGYLSAPAGEVEAPKPTKERKRRKETSENPPKPKKSAARRPKVDTAALSPETAQRLREQEEEEEDDCLLVNRKRKNADAPKPVEQATADEAHSRAEEISEGSSNKVPEPSSRKKVPRLGDHYEGEGERPDPKPFQIQENVPSGSLGVINVDDSPLGPEFSDGQIREAMNNMRSFGVGVNHEGHDIFRECLEGLDDGPDPDASFIFNEAMVLHKRTFSKSRDDLARCEAEIKKTLEERDAVKALYAKKASKIHNLQAELTQVCQDRAEYVEKFNQKADVETQLREELMVKEAEALGLGRGMDDLASEKEALKEQLALLER
ncbi:PREDICTED: uncharacterized protein LOC109227553 [Nicotiana attenuata]|uniref:uncharacterized protein LOC109227553 n=1 Tax=Nicotiana attenuata TaxID=49451 RepID=UPI000904CB7F|nr:PREDICTED: uncharacterized protein LOC109227553 [Nicotiana attenuata]